MKAYHPFSKHLNMYQNDHSAFHWLNAQAHCLPSLPKLLPEAQLEIIKRDEGALAVWRSRSVSLLPSLSICHAAAGSRPLCSQLSAQLEIIPLSLSANSRHVAVNITPPPSLSPSCSTHSLTWVCHELNDGWHQLHGKSGFSDGDIVSFGQHHSVELREWQEKKNCKYHFVWLHFLEIEAPFSLRDMCSPPCSMLLYYYLTGKQMARGVGDNVLIRLFVWLQLALLTLLSM